MCGQMLGQQGEEVPSWGGYLSETPRHETTWEPFNILIGTRWVAVRNQSDTIQSILIEHAMQSAVKSNYMPLPLLASIYGILMSEIMPKERKKYLPTVNKSRWKSPMMMVWSHRQCKHFRLDFLFVLLTIVLIKNITTRYEYEIRWKYSANAKRF